MTIDFKDGEPYWVDVSAPDVGAASRFYSALFGWQTEDQGEAFGHYTLLSSQGGQFGGIGPTPPDDQVAMWMPFFKVADADETAKAVEAAGGNVTYPPMEVGDQLVMAVFADPQGTGFAVSQPINHPGAQRWNQPGTPCNFTLLVRDPGVLGFYRKVFGWTVTQTTPGSSDRALTAAEATKPFGNLHVMGDFIPPEVPSSWAHDFMVEDVDDIVERATELGATVAVGPMDLPGAGRIAFLLDPNGAGFGVAAPHPGS